MPFGSVHSWCAVGQFATWKAFLVNFELPVIRPGSLLSAKITPYKPTYQDLMLPTVVLC